MNHPIQPFKALLKRSFYTHEVKDEKIFDEVYVFGIHSLEGHILMFHVMTSFGMLRSRVPLSELFWKVPTDESSQFKPTDKVLWNCFSTVNCEVVKYPYLEGIRAKVIMRNKKEVWASYLFTKMAVVLWVNQIIESYGANLVLFAISSLLIRKILKLTKL
jgi:hypothetical protein